MPQEMNPNPTFAQWLYYLRAQPGDAGDVARFAYEDVLPDGTPCWPMRAKTLRHALNHLLKRHNRQRKVTPDLLRQVFAQYERFVRDGGQVPVRRGGVPPSTQNVHRGYLIKKTTVASIREIAASEEGLTQGTLIDRLVESEVKRRARLSR